jgi:carbon-monoxide dehydrogenase medium subunit
MHPFTYQRPSTLDEAVRLLDEHGPAARIIAGGTDLMLGLRDYSTQPDVVVDLKRVPELEPAIRQLDGRLSISSGTVMADIEVHPVVLQHFHPLAEAAAVVGSVQIRNRATLAGNICNASPAADTAPPLLVYDATVVAHGPNGPRRIPIDEFFVRSRQTTLRRGELVTAIELPHPPRATAGAYLRITRRRGTDLASVTLCCTVDEAGITRIAFGSVGPRPLAFTDSSGVLADPEGSETTRRAILEPMLSAAAPSARSVRASPEYRLAMLRVLAERAVGRAIERLIGGSGT